MDSVEAKQLDAAEHALLRVPASGKKGIETSSDVADTSTQPLDSLSLMS